MEIKQRNVAGVRAIFDRLLVQRLSISKFRFSLRSGAPSQTAKSSLMCATEKGKSVFKKWLAFEKDHGDEQGVETVKQRAMAFVQSRQGGGQDGGDDDEE